MMDVTKTPVLHTNFTSNRCKDSLAYKPLVLVTVNCYTDVSVAILDSIHIRMELLQTHLYHLFGIIRSMHQSPYHGIIRWR